MDWIHCNICSLQPGVEQGRKFHLTSCGHIYCINCLAVGTKPVCKVCATKCSTIQLVSQMTPEVELYFGDPEELLRKTMQIMAFQRGHRNRLLNFRKSSSAKELAVADENTKLKAKLVQQTKHIAQLEAKLSQFKQVSSMRLSNNLIQSSSNNTGKTPNKSPSGMMLPPSQHGMMHYPASRAPISFQRTVTPSPSHRTGERRTPYFGRTDIFSQPVANKAKLYPAFGKLMQHASMRKAKPRDRFLCFSS